MCSVCCLLVLGLKSHFKILHKPSVSHPYAKENSYIQNFAQTPQH